MAGTHGRHGVGLPVWDGAHIGPMSWSDLERLVEDAEAEPGLRRALGHCRSLPEFLLACRRLGYLIERSDLRIAQRLDRIPAAQASAVPAPATPAAPHHAGEWRALEAG
jgi:hypothetical protein